MDNISLYPLLIWRTRDYSGSNRSAQNAQFQNDAKCNANTKCISTFGCWRQMPRYRWDSNITNLIRLLGMILCSSKLDLMFSSVWQGIHGEKVGWSRQWYPICYEGFEEGHNCHKNKDYRYVSQALTAYVLMFINCQQIVLCKAWFQIKTLRVMDKIL